MTLHEALLLSDETASIETLKRRFSGGSEEEGIASHEVGGGHEKAYGFHHIP